MPPARARQWLGVLTFVAAAGCQAGFWHDSGASGVDDAASADGAGAPTGTDVGQPTVAVIRRLNNAAYNNAVRDLFGTQLAPASAFVADDLTNGFDTVGATLQMSPTSVLGYLTAAEAVAAEATNPVATHIADALACMANEADDACVQRVLGALGGRVWRRPLTADEVTQLVAAAGGGAEASVAGRLYQGIVVLLMSPHFLFQVELDAEPASSQVAVVSDYELASRLAFFLWNSTPDGPLLAAAGNRTLHEDPVLEGHIERMLADARSEALIDHFASFWLGLTRAAVFVADARAYPDFNDAVRAAMLTETRTYLRDYILGDGPIAAMLDANYTYLNPQLAAYYNLPAPPGDGWAKTSLPVLGSAPRRGLLTQGAMLIAYSDPDSTNLIRRGKNVLSALLCTQIGPPPAGAGALPAAAADPNQTQRQRLEAHIINPSCAACHGLMDPIGYAYERFGPDARVRDTDNGSPIDASGTYNGEPFTGAHELAHLLANNAAVQRCAAKSLYTYALGVAPGSDDNPAISRLTQSFVAQGGKLRDLIALLAQSSVFRSRRAQGGTP